MRLIDADALRQVLEVFTEKDTLGHTPLQLCDAMPTVNQWRRVEELPKEEGKYLVYDGPGIYHVAWWGPRLGWCYDPKFFCYWMPLPEPPKEEE